MLYSSIELAKWMHDTYEDIAKGKGWETQLISRVQFDDLPQANRDTMVNLAEKLIEKFHIQQPHSEPQPQLQQANVSCRCSQCSTGVATVCDDCVSSIFQSGCDAGYNGR